jgi:WD40 repeat protein
VLVWDLTTRRILTRIGGYSSVVTAVAFSPDGTMLAVASDADEIVGKNFATAISWGGSKVKVYDPRTGMLLANLSGYGSVRTVAFSPDGKTLATADCEQTIRLWDVVSWAEQGVIEANTIFSEGLAFSPDGKTLATAGYDETVQLWDVATKRPLALLGGHKRGINSLAFSPDSTLLASAAEGVKIWDLRRRKMLASLPCDSEHANCVAFSPDGKVLAIGECWWNCIDPFFYPTVRLWDVTSGKLSEGLGWHNGGAICLAFSPDGKTLATGDGAGVIRLWDIPSP